MNESVEVDPFAMLVVDVLQGMASCYHQRNVLSSLAEKKKSFSSGPRHRGHGFVVGRMAFDQISMPDLSSSLIMVQKAIDDSSHPHPIQIVLHRPDFMEAIRKNSFLVENVLLSIAFEHPACNVLLAWLDGMEDDYVALSKHVGEDLRDHMVVFLLSQLDDSEILH